MQLFNQRCFAIMNPVMNLVMHSLTLGIYIYNRFILVIDLICLEVETHSH